MLFNDSDHELSEQEHRKQIFVMSSVRRSSTDTEAHAEQTEQTVPKWPVWPMRLQRKQWGECIVQIRESCGFPRRSEEERWTGAGITNEHGSGSGGGASGSRPRRGGGAAGRRSVPGHAHLGRGDRDHHHLRHRQCHLCRRHHYHYPHRGQRWADGQQAPHSAQDLLVHAPPPQPAVHVRLQVLHPGPGREAVPVPTSSSAAASAAAPGAAQDVRGSHPGQGEVGNEREGAPGVRGGAGQGATAVHLHHARIQAPNGGEGHPLHHHQAPQPVGGRGAQHRLPDRTHLAGQVGGSAEGAVPLPLADLVLCQGPAHVALQGVPEGEMAVAQQGRAPADYGGKRQAADAGEESPLLRGQRRNVVHSVRRRVSVLRAQNAQDGEVQSVVLL